MCTVVEHEAWLSHALSHFIEGRDIEGTDVTYVVSSLLYISSIYKTNHSQKCSTRTAVTVSSQFGFTCPAQLKSWPLTTARCPLGQQHSAVLAVLPGLNEYGRHKDTTRKT